MLNPMCVCECVCRVFLSLSLLSHSFAVFFLFQWHFQFKIVPSQWTTTSFHANSWKSDSEKMRSEQQWKKKRKSIQSIFFSLLLNLHIELKFSTRKSCNEILLQAAENCSIYRDAYQILTHSNDVWLRTEINEVGVELIEEFKMHSLGFFFQQFYNSILPIGWLIEMENVEFSLKIFILWIFGKKIVLFNREKKRKWKHYRIFVSILFLVIKISRIFCCCCCCFGSIRFGVVNDQADERDRKNQRAQQTIDQILEINRLKYSIDFWLLYILIFLPSGFSVLVIFAVSHNFFYIWLEISQPWP